MTERISKRLHDAAHKVSTLAAVNPALGITGYALMIATNDLIAWANAQRGIGRRSVLPNSPNPSFSVRAKTKVVTQ